jgi:hypothetical protein
VADKKPINFFLKLCCLINLKEIKVSKKHTDQDPVPDPQHWLKGQCHEIFFTPVFTVDRGKDVTPAVSLTQCTLNCENFSKLKKYRSGAYGVIGSPGKDD